MIDWPGRRDISHQKYLGSQLFDECSSVFWIWVTEIMMTFSPPWYVASPNQQYLDKSVNYEAGIFWDRSFKIIFTIATWYGKSYVERSQQNWTGYTTIMIMLM